MGTLYSLSLSQYDILHRPFGCAATASGRAEGGLLLAANMVLVLSAPLCEIGIEHVPSNDLRIRCEILVRTSNLARGNRGSYWCLSQGGGFTDIQACISVCRAMSCTQTSGNPSNMSRTVQLWTTGSTCALLPSSAPPASVARQWAQMRHNPAFGPVPSSAQFKVCWNTCQLLSNEG